MIDDSGHRSTADEPHAALVELAERLSGTWQVSGPEIEGEAEYRSIGSGRLLVASVDFVVSGNRMRNIQHITYDEDAAALRAHYMDTMGDESVYTWTLDGKKLRVSLGKGESGAYFEAAFNDDDSEYAGSWHYPDNTGEAAADERIVYKRIDPEAGG